jgi:hypothetical protein
MSQLEIQHNNDETLNKSEEVQVIIDSIPMHWVKWVVLYVSVLMDVIFLFGFLIL